MVEWEPILDSADLPVGSVREIEWQQQDLLLYRDSEGTCHAVSAYCPHMNNYMPNGLADGRELSALLIDDSLTCPWHGWRFDHRGRCTYLPPGQRAPAPVRRGAPVLKLWAVREDHGTIFLELSQG